MTLDTVTLSNGSAADKGGAIFNEGSVILNNSTVSGNNAQLGGAFWNESSTATLNNSTVSGNSASAHGGGLYSYSGTTSLSNSTVSGNSASAHGGGLYSHFGTTSLSNSTVSDNSATYGSGLYIEGGLATLSNSITAANRGGGDCFGTLTSDNNNWFEDDSCNSVAQGDPGLGPLVNNGGPTMTHALLPNSGAIDTGDDTICAAAPVNNLDQRGESRPVGEHCDIGAFEYKNEGQYFVIPAANGKTVIFSL